MNVYIIIAVVIGVFAIIETSIDINIGTRKNIHLLFFVFITLWAVFFIGFRECGFDYYSYYSLFEDFSSLGWKENASIDGVEYGYAFLNYFLGDFRLVLITMALITITLQFKFIYKYSPLPFVSLFLLLGVIFYPSIMGQYRQALAISLVLWAFVNKANKTKFLAIIFIASLFHASAFIGIIVLFLPDKLLKPRIYIIALIIALIFNLTMKSFFLSISNLLPALMSEKVDIYSSSEDFVLGLNFAMLLRIIVFLLFLFNKEKFLDYQYGSLFVNIYFISLVIYLSFGSIPQIAVRGSIYFYYLEFILVPMLLVKSNNLIRFLFLALFLGISISRQIGFFNEWMDDYIPYQNALLNSLSL